MSQEWEVVGGEDKGGIIVREGQSTSSARQPERLSTGARIEELECSGDRLHYRRKTGTGPEEGWISIKLSGKDLARKVSSPAQTEAEQKKRFDPYGALGVAPEATDAQIKSAFRKASLKVHPDKDPSPGAAEEFRRLAEAKDFLLSPLKRLMYNMAHGLQPRRHYVQWWSTWDEIFSEIDPAEANEPGPDEAAAANEPVTVPVESPRAPPTQARTDVLIFGATGLLGTLVCSLVQQILPGRSWAIIGRDERKLELLEQKFGKGPLYRGKFKLGSEDDLDGIVGTGRMVIDVSGPKFMIGSMVAAACVRTGTHCIDNTSFPGDTLYTKEVRDELDQKARDAGVSLCWFCGLGTVIFDIGTWLLVRHIRETHGLPTRRVDSYEISHGTHVTGSVILSARGVEGFEKKLKSTGYFFLGGEPETGLVEADDEAKAKPVLDRYSGMWANISEIPELIAVRCSYGLAKKSAPYGPNFRFSIWQLFPDQAAASMNALRLSNQFLRRGYQKHVDMKKIPAPGEGPCERLRKEAVCTRVLVAEADEGAAGEGRAVHCVCSGGPGGLGDHAEGSAHVLLEVAACALDVLDAGGALRPGFGTPVYHLAELGFVERLAARGLPFRTAEGAPAPGLFQNYLSSAGAIAQG